MVRLPIRLPQEGEQGIEFWDWLYEATGRDRAKKDRLLVFLQQWDHLSDTSQRHPSVEEYAERWSVPISSAYRALDEFRAVFPTEESPARVLSLLWDGMPRLPHQQFGPLMGVEIVSTAGGAMETPGIEPGSAVA